ncbi:MAG: hypothetical protein LLF95_00960 [Bacteroidales bacterium]|nr:hypothetical protein [Bacteroidales bacterium]
MLEWENQYRFEKKDITLKSQQIAGGGRENNLDKSPWFVSNNRQGKIITDESAGGADNDCVSQISPV